MLSFSVGWTGPAQLCNLQGLEWKTLFLKGKKRREKHIAPAEHGNGGRSKQLEIPQLCSLRAVWSRRGPAEVPQSAIEFDGGQRREQDPQRQAGANSCPDRSISVLGFAADRSRPAGSWSPVLGYMVLSAWGCYDRILPLPVDYCVAPGPIDGVLTFMVVGRSFKNLCPFLLRILYGYKCFDFLVIYPKRNSNRNFSW